jgi:hypothetical protein
VLKRESAALARTLVEIDTIVDDLCAVAEHQSIYYIWRPVLRDPSDELTLEVAMAGACQDIVTHNVRDFAGSERFAVRVSTPRDWLIRIGERP